MIPPITNLTVIKKLSEKSALRKRTLGLYGTCVRTVHAMQLAWQSFLVRLWVKTNESCRITRVVFSRGRGSRRRTSPVSHLTSRNRTSAAAINYLIMAKKRKQTGPDSQPIQISTIRLFNYMESSHNTVTGRSTSLLRIWEFPSYTLGLGTSYCVWGVGVGSWLSSATLGIRYGIVLNETTTTSFHIHSNSLLTNHPTMRQYNWAIDSVVK